MNYRNHSMLELVTILSDADDTYTFIQASKVFIQKFVDGDYVPREIHDEVMERVKDDAKDEGYAEARSECREEAVRVLIDNKGWLLHDNFEEDWDGLIGSMRLLA